MPLRRALAHPRRSEVSGRRFFVKVAGECSRGLCPPCGLCVEKYSDVRNLTVARQGLSWRTVAMGCDVRACSGDALRVGCEDFGVEATS